MELPAPQLYQNFFDYLQDLTVLCDLRLKTIYDHFAFDSQMETQQFIQYVYERTALTGCENFPLLTAEDILRLDTAEDILALKKRIVFYMTSPDMAIERPWLHLSRQKTPKDANTLCSGLCRSIAAVITAFPAGTGISETPKTQIIWIYGPAGCGRKFHLNHVAASYGLSLLTVRLDMLLSQDSFESMLREAILESILTDAVLCFDCAEVLFSCEEGKYASLFFHLTKRCSLIFCIATEPAAADCRISHRHYTEIAVPFPDFEARKKIWAHCCAPYVLSKDVLLSELASRLILTPLQIAQSVEAAYVMAITGEQTENGCIGEQSTKQSVSDNDASPIICMSHLLSAARRFSAPKLGTLGHLIRPVFSWDDLILPEKIKECLRQVIHRVMFAVKVYGEWGFAQKFPYGRGVCVLFSGSPGTGKTMAAQVLAGELGLSLYRINLAAVVSKYIGETEKNLQTIFRQAQNTNCILFFDEADSLFSKRTEVKDSHDRHANLEVSYLLQTLEDYEGITILATNLLKNFDDAFKRRFQYIIDFPFPDEQSRAEIWRSVFPDDTPLGEDIDFAALARSFKLSGSSIKNIALAASFHAAAKAKVVHIDDIIFALKEESARLGLPLLKEELGEYEFLL